MGFYERQVLPRVVDVLLGNAEMQRVRRPALAGLSGTVLELGFGSGPNLELYPADVDRVLAVDPSGVGWQLSERRREKVRLAVERVGLDGEHLAVDDRSVDHVVSTFTLCTIPDADSALREARRVLRPGGSLHYLEHGSSPDPGVRRWQERLEPLQRRIAGGCHLTREIEALVTAAGFELERAVQFDIRGPRPLSHCYSGVAVPADVR